MAGLPRSREDMHVADAVIAYGDLRAKGRSPEDIAARFGVALSYVKKVLRLSALHPEALICLAHDKIGMEAAQALTLTDDHDRQLEALKRCGNSAHQIRRMLTEEKIGTTSALFLFVGHDAYVAAGGTRPRVGCWRCLSRARSTVVNRRGRAVIAATKGSTRSPLPVASIWSASGKRRSLFTTVSKSLSSPRS